jgi:hypothetical protein
VFLAVLVTAPQSFVPSCYCLLPRRLSIQVFT